MPTENILNNFMHLVSKLTKKKDVWIFKKQKIKFDFKLSNKPVGVFLPHSVNIKYIKSQKRFALAYTKLISYFVIIQSSINGKLFILKS